MTRPATDYVRAFTQSIARDKILSVRSVMEPPPASMAVDGVSIRPDDRLGAIAKVVLEHDGPVPVVDEQGRRIGVVHSRQIIDLLFGGTA